MEHNIEHKTEEHSAHTTVHHKENKKDALLPAYIVGASILVAGIFVSATIFYTFKSLGSPTVPPAGTDTAIALDIRKDAPYLGNPNAKVVVVEYADYRCPFCERFYTDVMSVLKTKYIDTNKIKFVYQDFAFLGPDSVAAAEATHCAGDQNMYWQYHNYLFKNHGDESTDWASLANQKRFAQILGLNTTAFNNCLDTGKYNQRVKDETMAGSKYGVKGTPTVFINGKMLVGALPAKTFTDAIDEALK